MNVNGLAVYMQSFQAVALKAIGMNYIKRVSKRQYAHKENWHVLELNVIIAGVKEKKAFVH